MLSTTPINQLFGVEMALHYSLSHKILCFLIFRMTVLFFSLSGIDILGALDEVPTSDKQEIIEWIYSLQLTREGL